jgi:hypothetical protein
MENQVDRWLRLMGGPGWEGREARDSAVCEMQALGTETVFPLLTQKLSDPDLEVRCAAIEALGRVDAARAVEQLVPLLSDPEVVIRWVTCGTLSTPEALAAVEPLLAVLRNDLDPQVRNSAAYALGHIGSRAAIPALLRAMDTDHEPDIHCHTPSHCAAMALDDMLGTNCTRIRLSETTCTLRPGSPDLDGLRKVALQEYERWASGQA